MGLSFGVAFGVGLAALLASSPHFPGLPEQAVSSPSMTEKEDAVVQKDGVARRTVFIPHEKARIHGWLYTPPKNEGETKLPPVVVLVHGFGATKESDLSSLAEEVCRRGLAVLAIDFLRWGFSEGAPRHVSNPHRQLKEYESVLKAIVDSNGFDGSVDAKRIAVYGASLGGGLTLALVGHLQRKASPLLSSLKCAISAVPMVNGQKSSAHSLQKQSKGAALRASLLIALDALRSLIPKVSPLYFYGIARSSEAKLAFLPLEDDEFDEWNERVGPLIKDKSGGWTNKIAARSALHVSSFSPESYVRGLKTPLQTPTLIFAGSKDTVVPLKPIRELADFLQASGAPVKFEEWNDADHFSFIGKEQLPRFVDLMTGFFEQHLLK